MQTLWKKVILLIDEYDVPLDKAFQNSYYEEMVSLIRNMFGNVLKTNSNLYFAVLTGCLRIAKESIFTGLNNFEVLSVLDVQYDEYFGFTDTEVQDMLNYYDLSGHYTEVKEWYDGYQFGNTEVYCPWDVICYCKKFQHQTGRLLVQYQWKRNCTKIYQQSRQSDKKRHRKTDRRRDCNKGNPPGTDI